MYRFCDLYYLRYHSVMYIMDGHYSVGLYYRYSIPILSLQVSKLKSACSQVLLMIYLHKTLSLLISF